MKAKTETRTAQPGSVQRMVRRQRVWNCEIDGIRMDKGEVLEAARNYGYGGNDADEALFKLGAWGYTIRIW